VFLQAPDGEPLWSTPRASDRRVLAAAPNGALTLPIGVTGAAFRAETRGVAMITAVRAPCTIQSIASCDAAHRWRARVVIRA
jgi:hypothetical protein